MKLKPQWILAQFILLTIFGTLFHELGHVISSIGLGYQPKLHFGSTTTTQLIPPFQKFLITVSGIIITILTGTLALIVLIILKYKGKIVFQIHLILLSLFWSRECFVLMRDIGLKKHIGQTIFLSDEQKVSLYFGYHKNLLSFILGISGILICCYCILSFVPKKLRVSFILWGIIGSISGYLLWFKTIGPIILP